MGTMDKNGNDIDSVSCSNVINLRAKSNGIIDSNTTFYVYDPSKEFNRSNNMESFERPNEYALYHDDSLRKKLKNVEEDYLVLREEMQNAESFIDCLKKELSMKDIKMEKLRKMYEELQIENNKHKESLARFDEQVSNYKAMLVKDKQIKRELEQKISSLQVDKDDLMNTSGKLELLSKTNSLMKNKMKKCLDEYEMKCWECEALYRELSSLSSINIELETSLSDIINVSTIYHEENRAALLNIQMEYEEMNFEDDSRINDMCNNIADIENKPVVNSTPLLKSNLISLTKSLSDELNNAGESIQCCKGDSKYHDLDEKYSSLMRDLYKTAEMLEEVVNEIMKEKLNDKPYTKEFLDQNANESLCPEIDKIQSMISVLSDWVQSISTMDEGTQTDFTEINLEEPRSIFTSSLTLDQVNESDTSVIDSSLTKQRTYSVLDEAGDSSLLDTPLRSSFAKYNVGDTLLNDAVANSSTASSSPTTTCSSVPRQVDVSSYPRRKLSVYNSSFDVRDHQVYLRETPKNCDEDVKSIVGTMHNATWNKYRTSIMNESDSSENTSPLKSPFDPLVDVDEPPLEVLDGSTSNSGIFLAPTKLKLSDFSPENTSRSLPPIDLHLNLSDKTTKVDRFRNVTIRRYSNDPHSKSVPPLNLSISSLRLSSSASDKSSSPESKADPASENNSRTNNDVAKIEAAVDTPTCFVGDAGSEKASITEAAVLRPMSASECDTFSAPSSPSTFDAGESEGGPSRSNRSNCATAETTENAEGTETARRLKSSTMRRSVSESDVKDARLKDAKNVIQEKTGEEVVSFPSLTDMKLQLMDIAPLPDSSSETTDGAMENELERKYTSFSIGLAADRMTLSRRTALALRQRNQAENNLSTEIQRMKQDIQELTSFCTDKDAIEKIERARHQLKMVDKCAHSVSCTAETLGAIKQESRISGAISLADRYLQVLRTRCDKLASEVTEAKRILAESNVVLEEHPNEIGDDVPRVRYRAVNSANRTMIARRRASIATISRPLNVTQETTKDFSSKQRNSICGRVSSRRPSFIYERQSTDSERLDRAESETSPNETKEIIDLKHARHNSREENNNLLPRQCGNGVTGDGSICIIRESNASKLAIVHDIRMDSTTNNWQSISSTVSTRNPRLKYFIFISLTLIICYMLIKYLSTINVCNDKPCEWWSIEDILSSYIEFNNIGPKAI